MVQDRGFRTEGSWERVRESGFMREDSGGKVQDRGFQGGVGGMLNDLVSSAQG